MNILDINNDIFEYIKRFINLEYYNTLSIISKKFNYLYNINSLIKNNSLYNLYYSDSYCNSFFIKYINYTILKDNKYQKKNNKITDNIINHINNYRNYISEIAKNNNLFLIYDIIESQYHCINKKYKNIINFIVKINSYNLNLNKNEFYSICDFIIKYLNNKYNAYFYQYYFKTEILCKLLLSIILFNITSNIKKYSTDISKTSIYNLIKAQIDKLNEFKKTFNYYNKNYPKYFNNFMNNYLNNLIEINNNILL
tara:strand:+ start:8 stop:769 length:762 start_codon:yes stop_codon:yes gene_type:complete